jgi:O-antigen ligase
VSATNVETPLSETRESSLLRFSRWMLIVTFGALPLYVVRWHYGPLPTTLLETLILITLATYVVARWREGGIPRPIRTPYDIPIVLLVVAASIAVVLPPDHRAALGLYRAFFIEPVLIFYVAVDVLRGERYLRRAVVSFAVGSSLLAVLNLVAVAQALLHHTFHVGAAPNAVYGDANYVAMYLEPPVAFALAVLLFDRTARWRWLGAAWLAITGLALLLTLSKGAYLALIVLGVIVILRLRRWMLPLLVGLAVVAVLISRVPLVTQRIATSENSLVGRFQIYGATLRSMQDHWLFGWGIGGWDYIYRRKAPQPYPHDIWLTFWVELGLLGVIAFAIIFFGLLWRGWRGLPQTEAFYRVALWGVLGALVLWGVHGLADTPYWKNDMALEFWVMAAIELAAIWSITRRSVPEPAPPET